MKTVDARGLSCPEPVIMLKQAIGSDEIQLMVDNSVSVQTCTRFAKSKGYEVSLKQEDGIYTLEMRKG